MHTPDDAFNTMINTWNAYNCFITFVWSRAASFIYCGLRNGYGYRDTVQDIQGIIHLEPAMAKEKIRFMLSAQVDNGGGLPLVKFTHNPGHEDTPDDASYVAETGHPAYRADDALWLFPTVYKYVAETGDKTFLDEVIPFANKDEGTVYEHLKRAVQFSSGSSGIPRSARRAVRRLERLPAAGRQRRVHLCGTAVLLTLEILRRFAADRGDTGACRRLEETMADTARKIQDLCWDGDRFIRGFTEDGQRIGAAADPEANLWLNPQSWSVISGLATQDQAEDAMAQVYNRLNTAYGAVLMDPPYHAHAFEGALAVIYNPGTKENAGIFSQSQGLADPGRSPLRPRGTGLRLFYRRTPPRAQNDRAEIRRLEPYCYGQFTEGPASKHFGRSQVHWLTGTASTVMVGCVEGILGLRPDLNGLRLAPRGACRLEERLPWTRTSGARSCTSGWRIPRARSAAAPALTLNGEVLSDNYLPTEKLQAENDILLVL
ncbi:MAG: GH36-type glycosyl hydrolase domain-containing protein [Oscillospiraceae bacterium]